jgi:AI-2 transport protein TqsA
VKEIEMASSNDPRTSVDWHGLESDLRWSSRCLSIIATATIGLLLYVLRPVLAPFVVAVFFTVALRPILDVLQTRLHLSRLAAVATAFLVGVVLLLILGFAIASSIDQLANNDAYQQRAIEATERLASLAERLGILPSEDPASEVYTSSVARLQSMIRRGSKTAQDWLLMGMVSISGSIGVVIVYMLFLLLGASASSKSDSEIWNLIEGKLREYIVLKTVISAGTGIVVWAVLALFGVPLAMLMGLLTFLLNYVPNFGPLITCLLPLPLIWLSPDLSVGAMIVASLLACGVQMVGGNVVEPRMMGSSFELHPIVVLLALMLWYSIWGFVGMLLALPMTAALKVILERIDRTEFMARLMGGDLSGLQVGHRPGGPAER